MEHQIDGTVTGQRLEFTKKPELIVDGTNKYITAIFKFSPDWNGLSIWAHFDRGNSHWKIHLHDGEILRSDKLNLTQGAWEVSLHGTAVDGMRITTEPVDLSVRRTNIDGDEPLGGAPASPLEQIDQRVTALEAGGGGGGGGGTTDHSLLINRDRPDQHPMEAITGLTELRDKINTFFNADDPTLDQLAELIRAIKANQGTIEQLTNGKVNVSDIVNDLTTGGAGKVLSAEMGMELKRLIDAIKIPSVPTKTSQLQNDSGFITGADIPKSASALSAVVPAGLPVETEANTQAVLDALMEEKAGKPVIVTLLTPSDPGYDPEHPKATLNSKEITELDGKGTSVSFKPSPSQAAIHLTKTKSYQSVFEYAAGNSALQRNSYTIGPDGVVLGPTPTFLYAHANSVTATTPSSLPPETESNVQSILNALAEKKLEPLTFTGAANATYDGTVPKTINIPTVQDVLDALPKWTGGAF